MEVFHNKMQLNIAVKPFINAFACVCDWVRYFHIVGIRVLSSLRLVKSASWLVRELTSPWDVQSASWQSASWHVRELSSNHPTQHKMGFFWRCSSQPISWLVLKNLNLTRQKQTFAQNTKYYYTNKQKSKARFGCFVQPPTWKQSRPY